MQPRDRFGKWKVPGLEMTPVRKVSGSFIILIALVVAGGTIVEKMPSKVLFAQNVFADELPKKAEGLTLEELETELDALVWGNESQGYVMKEGDIFETFDPADVEYQKCITIGGRQPKYCLSRGPRQIKLSMIQDYWPKIHGEKISDKAGRDITEGNESSRRFFLDCAVQIGTPSKPYECARRWTSFRNNAAKGEVLIDLIRKEKEISIN